MRLSLGNAAFLMRLYHCILLNMPFDGERLTNYLQWKREYSYFTWPEKWTREEL